MAFKFFYNVYKAIDESIRKNYIVDIMINENGHVAIGIGTEFKDSKIDLPFFSLEKIKTTELVYNSLCKKDRKLIDALLLAEGDLVIKNFDYETNNFELISLLYSNDHYSLTKDEIIQDDYIVNRINKNHLKKIYENS